MDKTSRTERGAALHSKSDALFGWLPRVAAAVVMTAAAVGIASIASHRNAHAQASPSNPGDPASGRAIAERLCANCHLLNDVSSPAVPVGVLAFKAMANRPDQTFERLVTSMLKPHAPMIDAQLTREEIIHVIAYLETLRSKELQTAAAHRTSSLRRDHRRYLQLEPACTYLSNRIETRH